MGIGTSLGAYFETSLDHHAGSGLYWNDKFDENENVIEGDTNQLKTDPTYIIPVANITNTPGEILEGLEGTRVFGSGYGVPGPTQLRRPANSNKKSGQIDDPVMDANIEASWDRMVRGQQIVADRQSLINTQSERTLNDIEKARLNKLDKEHAKHFGNYYPD